MFPCLIFQAIKGFIQKSIVRITSIVLCCWPRKSSTANPILPIQNPAPTSDDNSSSLVQPLLFSNLLSTNDNHNYDIQENDHDIVVDVVFSHDEITPKPDSMICVSDVFKQEISPQEEKEEDKAVIISSRVSVVFVGGEICIWMKHYSSRHRILVVGDGDFSFSASLALAFGCHSSNMISTSLDSKEFLKSNYKKALLNIMELKARKCKVIHGIDATIMANCASLKLLKFDRIIFNFPFAGFFKNLSRKSQLRHHRRLVSLFMKNAREMLIDDGEIHITHKTNGFHAEWNLVSVASSHGLKLIEAVKFNQLDYPGYNTKCGFGGNNNFDCNPSKTYKFSLKKARH